jgi:hypothetical protein
MLTFCPSRILNPGVKKSPDPGSGSATLFNGADPERISHKTDLFVFSFPFIKKIILNMTKTSEHG